MSDPQPTEGVMSDRTRAAFDAEIGRLRASLVRMNAQRLVIQAPARPTPFAFPLMVERFREKLSNEDVADRIARMVQQLELAAGGEVPVGDVSSVRKTLAFGRSSDVGAPKLRGKGSKGSEPDEHGGKAASRRGKSRR